MTFKYIITDEFIVKDSKVLVLDRQRCLVKDSAPLIFIMDGKTYTYKLTHNRNWIIVDSDDKFEGNVIEIDNAICEPLGEIL